MGRSLHLVQIAALAGFLGMTDIGREYFVVQGVLFVAFGAYAFMTRNRAGEAA